MKIVWLLINSFGNNKIFSIKIKNKQLKKKKINDNVKNI